MEGPARARGADGGARVPVRTGTGVTVCGGSEARAAAAQALFCQNDPSMRSSVCCRRRENATPAGAVSFQCGLQRASYTSPASISTTPPSGGGGRFRAVLRPSAPQTSASSGGPENVSPWFLSLQATGFEPSAPSGVGANRGRGASQRLHPAHPDQKSPAAQCPLLGTPATPRRVRLGRLPVRGPGFGTRGGEAAPSCRGPAAAQVIRSRSPRTGSGHPRHQRPGTAPCFPAWYGRAGSARPSGCRFACR
jgi:hypothetical protein